VRFDHHVFFSKNNIRNFCVLLNLLIHFIRGNYWSMQWTTGTGVSWHFFWSKLILVLIQIRGGCILSIPLSPFSLPISKYYQRCLYPVGIYIRWPHNSNLWNERRDFDKSTMILYGIKRPALNVVLSSSHIITWCTWLQVYTNPITGLIPPMVLYWDGANMYRMVCGQTLLIPICRLSLRELLVFCLAFYHTFCLEVWKQPHCGEMSEKGKQLCGYWNLCVSVRLHIGSLSQLLLSTKYS
jgi:hypothetical protein